MIDRRQQILDAALPIFLEKGYIGTTIADIRKASGATTGSIYHFFSGKAGLAIALWSAANGLWTTRAEAVRQSSEPRELVTATVRGLLEWATANRNLFLFFEELRIRAYSDPELQPILDQIAQTHDTAAAMYQAWAAEGHVRAMEWPVASALIVGPSYDYLRKCGHMSDHTAAIEMLVERAWDSVSRD
ncbi:TetR/AcrR family transcriptional regulator [Martelella mediterranea]|uniref:TetR/AcrR family transcriptional regulator n=1 Tax=Martelella mediterranea TaxID=293089 RepID=UPI001E3AF3D5|nr:TetR/AcrR family transcriptional regulator [Martelella mediterranea]MCD1632521.1 TetR/AcrR family transcriptional regulator [Martelella mediterranea]